MQKSLVRSLSRRFNDAFCILDQFSFQFRQLNSSHDCQQWKEIFDTKFSSDLHLETDDRSSTSQIVCVGFYLHNVLLFYFLYMYNVQYTLYTMYNVLQVNKEDEGVKDRNKYETISHNNTISHFNNLLNIQWSKRISKIQFSIFHIDSAVEQLS